MQIKHPRKSKIDVFNNGGTNSDIDTPCSSSTRVFERVYVYMYIYIYIKEHEICKT